MGERVVLTANEGMVFTNGINYGKVIHLAEGENHEDYYQIPMEEYEELLLSTEHSLRSRLYNLEAENAKMLNTVNFLEDCIAEMAGEVYG